MKFYYNSGRIHIQPLMAVQIFIAEPSILFLFPSLYTFFVFPGVKLPQSFHSFTFLRVFVFTCFHSSVKILFFMIFCRWENSSVLFFSWTHSFWNPLFFSIWIGCSLSYCIIVIMGFFFSIILGMICLILFPESCGFLLLRDCSNLRMASLWSHMRARLTWYRIQDFEACLIVS